MKSPSRLRAALSIFVLAAASSLPSSVQAGSSIASCSAVSLSESDCGDSRVVMVFARVGERFRYELSSVADQSSVVCVVGKNAEGKKSSLPQGLVFNAKDATLEGMPLRSGFHEFVVLREENGATQERVVLIDIQGHGFASGGVDYASYVSGGIR